MSSLDVVTNSKMPTTWESADRARLKARVTCSTFGTSLKYLLAIQGGC